MYKVLSKNLFLLTESNIETLKNLKCLLTSDDGLVYPEKGYLIRAGEEIIQDRLERSGFKFNVIFSENVETDALFLKLGAKEIVSSISSTKSVDSEPVPNKMDTLGVKRILPWLDGFEYRLTGDVSDQNLIFKDVLVFRQNELRVQYRLDGLESSNSLISDFCCIEKVDNLCIYLSGEFSFRVNDHVNLLTLFLIKHLNSQIKYVQWSLILPQLFNSQKIFGISPYHRKTMSPEEADTSEWERNGIMRTSRVRTGGSRSRLLSNDVEREQSSSKDPWEADQAPVASGAEIIRSNGASSEDTWTPEVDYDQTSAIEPYVPSTEPSQDDTYGSDADSSGTDTRKESEHEPLSQQDRIRIGNWGEAYSNDALKERLIEKYPNALLIKIENGYRFLVNNTSVADLIWENEDKEQKKPYDIHLTETDREAFYEVKTTITNKKDWFKVSRNQWHFAKLNKEKYHVLRVYQAGTTQTKIVEYKTLYRLWLEEKISARPMEIYV